MAEAQYEIRTETVEKTVVVLTLTEDEASSLKGVLEALDYTGCLTSLLASLTKPTAPETSADTFEYGGVTYDLHAAYIDQEDDTWTFTGRRTDGGDPYVTMYAGRDNRGDTLSSIVHGYGPLEKVTS
ncbi:phiSA1p31-related protein [Streptomyces sp. ITFR-6]|uniref:phiSA1p31-related protein n=1 Tax=Streptomyces sp. ITFR-6 TaxID=3075197 RepID=UPI00288BB442|nr:phiSA1p31-related protein [Streptomyces sp. ITFR-6]WNI28623.1 phiSA1p31-related protein [Streptomyces sp. ITFR-6]